MNSSNNTPNYQDETLKSGQWALWDHHVNCNSNLPAFHPCPVEEKDRIEVGVLIAIYRDFFCNGGQIYKEMIDQYSNMNNEFKELFGKLPSASASDSDGELIKVCNDPNHSEFGTIVKDIEKLLQSEMDKQLIAYDKKFTEVYQDLK